MPDLKIESSCWNRYCVFSDTDRRQIKRPQQDVTFGLQFARSRWGSTVWLDYWQRTEVRSNEAVRMLRRF